MLMVSTCMLIQFVIMSCNDIPIDRFIDVFDKHTLEHGRILRDGCHPSCYDRLCRPMELVRK